MRRRQRASLPSPSDPIRVGVDHAACEWVFQPRPTGRTKESFMKFLRFLRAVAATVVLIIDSVTKAGKIWAFA